MSESIQNKRNQQSYLRQVQQEKASRKRDLNKAQTEDIKSVRSYYADQTKQLEIETEATINHIKEESRQMAAAERQERADRAQFEAEQKQMQREEIAASRSQNAGETSEKKNSLA